MSRKLVKRIGDVTEGVRASMHRDTNRDCMFSRGMSTEGFNGGYLQALYDMQGFLNGYTNLGSRHEALWKAAPPKS